MKESIVFDLKYLQDSSCRGLKDLELLVEIIKDLIKQTFGQLPEFLQESLDYACLKEILKEIPLIFIKQKDNQTKAFLINFLEEMLTASLPSEKYQEDFSYELLRKVLAFFIENADILVWMLSRDEEKECCEPVGPDNLQGEENNNLFNMDLDKEIEGG